MSLPFEFKIIGTPRTAGSESHGDWKKSIEDQLMKQFEGRDRISTRVKIEVLFKIEKKDTDYHGHGPDLDNLLKPVLDVIAKVMLCASKSNPNEKGDFLVYKVTAEKEIVGDDEGVEFVMGRY